MMTVDVNIALQPLRSCFECRHGIRDTNDNGMAYIECPILEGTPVGQALYHEYDEKLLPRHCGHFEYITDTCEVCGKKMDTVTYMNSIYGVLPICSQACAQKQAEKEDRLADELYNTRPGT
jgi:hypothetical protein